MKKLILGLMVLGVCLVPAVAKATPIPIGLAWQETSEGGDVHFAVFNFTGTDTDFGFDYPVSTPLWFFAPTADATKPFRLGPGGFPAEAPATILWPSLRVAPFDDPEGTFAGGLRVMFNGATYQIDQPDALFDPAESSITLEGTEVVPEPATLLLVGPGIVGLVRARRRR